ncbi:MAG TPA: DUF2268 domain-containing putative Zn-dependent protease [Candidatus Paceibacterota bacterium]
MKIEIKNNAKIIAYVHLPCVDYGLSDNDKNGLLDCLLREIEDSDSGYAGFSTKENLNNYLRGAVFDKADDNNHQYTFTLDEVRIIKTITKAIKKCSDLLPGKITSIFVFPTFSQFVKEEMSGTTGYTPWPDTILIFINPANPQYDRALSETVGHEFNHAIFLRDKKCESLLDSMIFEGLAERFREQVIGGGQAPWTKIFGLNRAKVIFLEMKLANLLQLTNPEICRGVFFGNEKYIRWTGYALGYHIVKSFLENNPSLDWKEIMTRQPKDIFSGSSFGNK